MPHCSLFLSSNSLTDHLSSAETILAGADAAACSDVIETFEFSEDLLDAALSVRKHVGRLSDVIHATTIARCLPLILEPGETVTVRPSLGAGNDVTRPFDLETDRRVAEFKVAQWKGADTMRKRGLFADLVHLALDQSGRHAQLFVVGQLPRKFLSSSKSTAQWALARSSPHLRARYTEAFGDADTTVAEFTSGPGRKIEIVDLASLVPSLAEADNWRSTLHSLPLARPLLQPEELRFACLRTLFGLTGKTHSTRSTITPRPAAFSPCRGLSSPLDPVLGPTHDRWTRDHLLSSDSHGRTRRTAATSRAETAVELSRRPTR